MGSRKQIRGLQDAVGLPTILKLQHEFKALLSGLWEFVKQDAVCRDWGSGLLKQQSTCQAWSYNPVLLTTITFCK